MNNIAKIILTTTLALASLVASARETKKLWHYLEKNELGKSGTYYGYYASRLNHTETKCRAFLQGCADALAQGELDTFQNGDHGIYRMNYLGENITETVENITDMVGGYYTVLLFRATDGSVYVAEPYATTRIVLPDAYHSLSITNAVGEDVSVTARVVYEGYTTGHFRLAADAEPLSVRTPDAPHITDMQMTTDAVRITIDNACTGCRYRVITSTTLDGASFIPDTDSEILASADGDLELTTPIGEGRVRFYRVEALSDEL